MSRCYHGITLLFGIYDNKRRIPDVRVKKRAGLPKLLSAGIRIPISVWLLKERQHFRLDYLILIRCEKELGQRIPEGSIKPGKLRLGQRKLYGVIEFDIRI